MYGKFQLNPRVILIFIDGSRTKMVFAFDLFMDEIIMCAVKEIRFEVVKFGGGN